MSRLNTKSQVYIGKAKDALDLVGLDLVILEVTTVFDLYVAWLYDGCGWYEWSECDVIIIKMVTTCPILGEICDQKHVCSK